MKIESTDDFRRAAETIYAQIESGRAGEAIEFADGCTGVEALTFQLRATAYTDAGEKLNSAEIVGRGAEMWRLLGTANAEIALRAGNAEYALWRLANQNLGFVGALESMRTHLDSARELFEAAGNDEESAPEIRVQALTNLGNSFDGAGRDVDAIAAYDKALSVDPSFGMALGNKATTLLGIVPHTREHAPALIASATEALDRALQDEARILRTGGASALANFTAHRERITGEPSKESHQSTPWPSSYLAWCFSERLFLHASLECLRPDTEMLDPIFFQGLKMGFSESERERVNRLIDAFDSLKQDFLAARYTTWLAVSQVSPIYSEAKDLSGRVKYFDSLKYARWGLRTGMALQAFTTTINLLDKVASFVHLYLEISRRPKVYFRTLWHLPVKKGHDASMHLEIAERLQRQHFNRGLSALCDLSCDLERDTLLNDLVERRHAATHRFLVAHEINMPTDADSSEWLERVEWSELKSWSVTQLRTARAALIYLARAVDIEEMDDPSVSTSDGPTMPTLPMWPVDSDLSEID